MKFSKGFLPIVALFLLLTTIFFAGANLLEGYGIDTNVLIWGNLFLFILSSISFFIQQKALQSSSPQVFTRYFYLSFVVKFILVATTVLLYSFSVQKVSKASILICMVVYMMYVFLEISFVLKSLRKKK